MPNKETVKARKELLKQMNQYIIDLGDEEIWIDWIMVGVPDEPCEEDYQFIAENDNEWVDICKLFGQLIVCAEREV